MYCAEQVECACRAIISVHTSHLCPVVSQIKVPPNLADVLKAYTKEVIRQQPANILEFSSK